MKLGISGPGESGKDTAAEWFGKNTNLGYKCGTSAYAADIVFDVWGKNHYSSSRECWEDRRNHRKKWAEIIGEFNREDPVNLYRECLKNQDILTGIRFRHEFLAIKEAKLCDLWIWIKKDNVPHDPTMEYTEDDCDITITNNGTIEDLHVKLGTFSRMLHGITVRGRMVPWTPMKNEGI